MTQKILPCPVVPAADSRAGQSVRAWTFFGSHPCTTDGGPGYLFRVWAPQAAAVSIVGDFNDWTPGIVPMARVGEGVWEGRIPGLARYDCYKYAVTGADGAMCMKADPYAFHAETRPGNASKIYDLDGYEWGDGIWLSRRKRRLAYHNPLNIYEVHLGSWRRTAEGKFLSYRDLADWLVPYVKEMGFTHVELLPITEHPLDDSWGYQCTGYFAVTSRFGTPHDFMYLVDQLHQAGVGVILDWVPAHFPKDAFGLYEFDGQPCYEYADPRKREHRDWGTRVFDYGKKEVCAFLISSALFWLEQFHMDGLRVDAVASMLYLDYGRKSGEWAPNSQGGRENLEAVAFLRELNEVVFFDHPDILMIAEESTAWPLVSHPVSEGGLGFNLKWNMGWMNDVLHYAKLDPYFRQFNHKDITFSLMYAFSENFVLPLSHDEVVHMKGSLIGKMPGDDAEKYAGVRAFYSFMLAHPGKKLLFMGAEFGQFNEWHFEYSLDWNLLQEKPHQQLQAFFQAANAFYLDQKPLWEADFSWEGFQWICADDNKGNTVAFLRKDRKGKFLLAVSNFSPIHRDGYHLGVPAAGRYRCIFNSDDAAFGGGGLGDRDVLASLPKPCHGQDQSIVIDLPPMSTVFYRCIQKTRRQKSPAPAAIRGKSAGSAKRKKGADGKEL